MSNPNIASLHSSTFPIPYFSIPDLSSTAHSSLSSQEEKTIPFMPLFSLEDQIAAALYQYKICDEKGRNLLKNQSSQSLPPLDTRDPNDQFILQDFRQYLTHSRKLLARNLSSSVNLLPLEASINLNQIFLELLQPTASSKDLFRVPIKEIFFVGTSELEALGSHLLYKASLFLFPMVPPDLLHSWLQQDFLKKRLTSQGEDEDFWIFVDEQVDTSELMGVGDQIVDQVGNQLLNFNEDSYHEYLKHKHAYFKEHSYTTEKTKITKRLSLYEFACHKRKLIFNQQDQYFIFGLTTQSKPIEFSIIKTLHTHYLFGIDCLKTCLKNWLLNQTPVLSFVCDPLTPAQYLIDHLTGKTRVIDRRLITYSHALRFLRNFTKFGICLCEPDENEASEADIFEKLFHYKTSFWNEKKGIFLKEHSSINLSSDSFYLFYLLKTKVIDKNAYEKSQPSSHNPYYLFLYSFNLCQSWTSYKCQLPNFNQDQLDLEITHLWSLLDHYQYLDIEQKPFYFYFKKALLEEKIPFSVLSSWLQILTWIFSPNSLTKHEGKPIFRLIFDEEYYMNLPCQPLVALQKMLPYNQTSLDKSIFLRLYQNFVSVNMAHSVYPSPLTPYLSHLPIDSYALAMFANTWVESPDPFLSFLGFQLHLATPSFTPDYSYFSCFIKDFAKILKCISHNTFPFFALIENLTYQSHQLQFDQIKNLLFKVQQLLQKKSVITIEEWIEILSQSNDSQFIYYAYDLFLKTLPHNQKSDPQQTVILSNLGLKLLKNLYPFYPSRAVQLLGLLYQENLLLNENLTTCFISVCHSYFNQNLEYQSPSYNLELANLAFPVCQNQSAPSFFLAQLISTLLVELYKDKEEKIGDHLLIVSSRQKVLINPFLFDRWMDRLEQFLLNESWQIYTAASLFQICRNEGFLQAPQTKRLDRLQAFQIKLSQAIFDQNQTEFIPLVRTLLKDLIEDVIELPSLEGFIDLLLNAIEEIVRNKEITAEAVLFLEKILVLIPSTKEAEDSFISFLKIVNPLIPFLDPTLLQKIDDVLIHCTSHGILIPSSTSLKVIQEYIKHSLSTLRFNHLLKLIEQVVKHTHGSFSFFNSIILDLIKDKKLSPEIQQFISAYQIPILKSLKNDQEYEKIADLFIFLDQHLAQCSQTTPYRLWAVKKLIKQPSTVGKGIDLMLPEIEDLSKQLDPSDLKTCIEFLLEEKRSKEALRWIQIAFTHSCFDPAEFSPLALTGIDQLLNKTKLTETYSFLIQYHKKLMSHEKDLKSIWLKTLKAFQEHSNSTMVLKILSKQKIKELFEGGLDPIKAILIQEFLNLQQQPCQDLLKLSLSLFSSYQLTDCTLWLPIWEKIGHSFSVEVKQTFYPLLVDYFNLSLQHPSIKQLQFLSKLLDPYKEIPCCSELWLSFLQQFKAVSQIPPSKLLKTFTQHHLSILEDFKKKEKIEEVYQVLSLLNHFKILHGETAHYVIWVGEKWAEKAGSEEQLLTLFQLEKNLLIKSLNSSHIPLVNILIQSLLQKKNSKEALHWMDIHLSLTTHLSEIQHLLAITVSQLIEQNEYDLVSSLLLKIHNEFPSECSLIKTHWLKIFQELKDSSHSVKTIECLGKEEVRTLFSDDSTSLEQAAHQILSNDYSTLHLETLVNLLSVYPSLNPSLWMFIWEKISALPQTHLKQKTWTVFKKIEGHLPLIERATCWTYAIKTLADIKHSDLFPYLSSDTLLETLFSHAITQSFRLQVQRDLLLGCINQLLPSDDRFPFLLMIILKKRDELANDENKPELSELRLEMNLALIRKMKTCAQSFSQTCQLIEEILDQSDSNKYWPKLLEPIEKLAQVYNTLADEQIANSHTFMKVLKKAFQGLIPLSLYPTFIESLLPSKYPKKHLLEILLNFLCKGQAKDLKKLKKTLFHSCLKVKIFDQGLLEERSFLILGTLCLEKGMELHQQKLALADMNFKEWLSLFKTRAQLFGELIFYSLERVLIKTPVTVEEIEEAITFYARWGYTILPHPDWTKKCLELAIHLTLHFGRLNRSLSSIIQKAEQTDKTQFIDEEKFNFYTCHILKVPSSLPPYMVDCAQESTQFYIKTAMMKGASLTIQPRLLLPLYKDFILECIKHQQVASIIIPLIEAFTFLYPPVSKIGLEEENTQLVNHDIYASELIQQVIKQKYYQNHIPTIFKCYIYLYPEISFFDGRLSIPVQRNVLLELINQVNKFDTPFAIYKAIRILKILEDDLVKLNPSLTFLNSLFTSYEEILKACQKYWKVSINGNSLLGHLISIHNQKKEERLPNPVVEKIKYFHGKQFDLALALIQEFQDEINHYYFLCHYTELALTILYRQYKFFEFNEFSQFIDKFHQLIPFFQQILSQKSPTTAINIFSSFNPLAFNKEIIDVLFAPSQLLIIVEDAGQKTTPLQDPLPIKSNLFTHEDETLLLQTCSEWMECLKEASNPQLIFDAFQRIIDIDSYAINVKQTDSVFIKLEEWIEEFFEPNQIFFKEYLLIQLTKNRYSSYGMYLDRVERLFESIRDYVFATQEWYILERFMDIIGHPNFQLSTEDDHRRNQSVNQLIALFIDFIDLHGPTEIVRDIFEGILHACARAIDIKIFNETYSPSTSLFQSLKELISKYSIEASQLIFDLLELQFHSSSLSRVDPLVYKNSVQGYMEKLIKIINMEEITFVCVRLMKIITTIPNTDHPTRKHLKIELAIHWLQLLQDFSLSKSPQESDEIKSKSFSFLMALKIKEGTDQHLLQNEDKEYWSKAEQLIEKWPQPFIKFQ
jgi:hypothetical protein